MNIKEAKQEISNTLRAYHQKDSEGNYCYPLIRQRPILLMGPPGIGKTAVMEQVAEECQVGLVAYTITHHTRQSAVGLPHIEQKTYGGQTMNVTEYTMSEIIASVYECMERTGKQEGILFIDEINCVSETLAPTMLQFLQNKTFGSHRVPDGWMIVAAGNPPEYNKSVREFDIVTLDRVRKMEIEADCEVWMEYAWGHGIHGAILSYLNIYKDEFYYVENTADAKIFVTARGWEDLSKLLLSYEQLEIPISKELTAQFLQKEETSRRFTAYYQLYRKFGLDYAIPEILSGRLEEQEHRQRTAMAKQAGFEERFTVVGLILDYLNQTLDGYIRQQQYLDELYEVLKLLKNYQLENRRVEKMGEFLRERHHSLKIRMQADLLSGREQMRQRQVLSSLEEYWLLLQKQHIVDWDEGFEQIREWFDLEVQKQNRRIEGIGKEITAAFDWVLECFGDGQELILLLSGLTGNEKAMEFISSHGCERFMEYSERMLYRRRRKELQRACEEMR